MERGFRHNFRRRVEARAAFKKRIRARNFTHILKEQYGVTHIDDSNHFWYIGRHYYQEEDFVEYTNDPEGLDLPDFIDRDRAMEWLDKYRAALVWTRHQVQTPGQKSAQECLQILRYAYGVQVNPETKTWSFTKDFSPPAFLKYMPPLERNK
jgi:hypothetical protein